MIKMTREQHIERHKQLHRSLDELVADYLEHHSEAMPSTTILMDLMKWSHEQTKNPTDLPIG